MRTTLWVKTAMLVLGTMQVLICIWLWCDLTAHSLIFFAWVALLMVNAAVEAYTPWLTARRALGSVGLGFAYWTAWIHLIETVNLMHIHPRGWMEMSYMLVWPALVLMPMPVSLVLGILTMRMTKSTVAAFVVPLVVAQAMSWWQVSPLRFQAEFEFPKPGAARNMRYHSCHIPRFLTSVVTKEARMQCSFECDTDAVQGLVKTDDTTLLFGVGVIGKETNYPAPFWQGNPRPNIIPDSVVRGDHAYVLSYQNILHTEYDCWGVRLDIQPEGIVSKVQVSTGRSWGWD